eukprot:514722-Amphidinium_carterae.1
MVRRGALEDWNGREGHCSSNPSDRNPAMSQCHGTLVNGASELQDSPCDLDCLCFSTRSEAYSVNTDSKTQNWCAIRPNGT